MSSKMREALRDAAIAGQKAERNGRPFGMSAIDEIAQRHGDLEFTREEMLKLMEAAGKAQVRDRNDAEIILSRHTEAEGKEKYLNRADAILDEKKSARYGPDGKHVADTPTIKASEIEALSKRVAAIEKRLLADGHSASCGKREVITDNKCTCGHDDIRESRK